MTNPLALYRRYVARRLARNLFVQSEMPRGRGEPHRLTVNALMKQALGIGPNERADDSDSIKAQRYAAVEELKLLKRDKAKAVK